jgi:hypothetical protein
MATAEGSVSLGQFGTPRELEEKQELTFGWFGSQLRVNPYASELDLIEFMASAGELEEDDIRVIPALQRLLKAYVHPEDWAEFWKLARRNHQEVGDFLALCYAIVEATTGRPTVRPAASGGGPSTTVASSMVDSFSLDEQRAFEMLAGRPDLGTFVLLAHDAAQEPATG